MDPHDSFIAFMVLILGLGGMATVFSIPGLLIWTYHRRKMEELKLQRSGLTKEEIRAEFVSVRAEIQALRDTSTQYDLSFDNALQQMEHRLGTLERRAQNSVAEETVQSLYTGIR